MPGTRSIFTNASTSNACRSCAVTVVIVFTSQSGEPGREEFVYLLRWKDRETQVSAWKKFLEDPEWIGVKKATSAKWGDLVDDVQDRSLDMMPYTPKPSSVP
jgi:hypothetical protein